MSNWDEQLAATAPGAPPDAAEEATPADADAGVRELAALPSRKYEQVRESEAKRLGIRVGVLDKAVKGYRRAGANGVGDDHMLPSPVEETEPADDPIGGSALADAIREGIRSRVIFTGDHDADAVTLWVLGSWLMDRWRLWPKMLIKSPERGCGKTTGRLVRLSRRLPEPRSRMMRQVNPVGTASGRSLRRDG